MESNNSMFAGRGRQPRSSPLNASEKRRRNKSLCSALVTPPSYPGYGKINSNSNKAGAGSADNLLLAQRVKHAIRRATDPPNIAATTMVMTTRQQRRPTPTFTIEAAEEERRKSLVAAQNAGLPPPASFFNNAVRQETVFPARTKSWNDAVVLRQQLSSFARRSSAENGCSSLRPVAENGVGADSVEHLQQQQQQEWVSRRRRRRREGRANSLIEMSRRRSMFADGRRRRDPYFNDEMLRALELERITFFCGSQDEDGSNGGDSTMPAQPINRPESVLELARKFSSASAHQELERHKAGVQINSTRSSGDSASLSTTYLYGNNSIEMARSCSGPCTPVHHVVTPPCFYGESHMATKQTADQQLSVGDEQRKKSMPVRPRSPGSIKTALLKWCQSKTRDYPGVQISNFSSSWCDGMAFCALIHHFHPDAFDFSKLKAANRRGNFELAFRVAEEKADIMPLLEVDDMLLMGDKPDWKCVFTYVQSFYKQFRYRD